MPFRKGLKYLVVKRENRFFHKYRLKDIAMSCSKVVPTFVMLLLVVGIGGMIGAAYGSYWYTDTKFHTGLWRSCINETNCQERNYILQFAKVSFNEIDNQGMIFDILLFNQY